MCEVRNFNGYDEQKTAIMDGKHSFLICNLYETIRLALEFKDYFTGFEVLIH